MQVRPTQASNFALVQAGLSLNFAKLVRAQEQIASGKRVLRPSDDPAGSSTILSLKRQLGDVSRFREAAQSGKPVYDAGIAAVEEAQSLLAEAKSLVLEGLNGTVNENDRATLATSIRLLHQRMLELGNSKFNGSHLFAGTASDAAPFVDQNGRVVYNGDDSTRSVAIGFEMQLALNLPGGDVFASEEGTGTQYVGSTGAARGTTADEGSGYVYLSVRHDATSGTLGSGLALVSGGAADTFLGDRTLTIDATAGTVQLGSGPAVAIPTPASSDFVVTDEHGAELHLDFSAYTGTSSSSTLTGSGSVSLDGSSFTALDLNDSDFAVRDSARGVVLHVDATGIARAGRDLVTFQGTVNAFDVLQGIAEDLDNVHDLDVPAVLERLSSRIAELDRNHENLLGAASDLGAHSARLSAVDARLQDLDLSLKSLLSDVEEVDLSSVILDMTQAEQTLQIAQATGARLLQNSLLNYLR